MYTTTKICIKGSRTLLVLEGDNIGYGLKNGLGNDWIQNICLLKAWYSPDFTKSKTLVSTDSKTLVLLNLKRPGNSINFQKILHLACPG